MPKLTKRVVDAAEIRPSEYFILDDELVGFGLRVLPSGKKRYIVQYRASRRSRRMSLGPSAVLTCEQPRSRAITILAASRNGDDPAARHDADRRAITVKELAERFDKEHIALRLKESTAKGYRRMLERVIILGARAVSALLWRPRVWRQRIRVQMNVLPNAGRSTYARTRKVPSCWIDICAE